MFSLYHFLFILTFDVAFVTLFSWIVSHSLSVRYFCYASYQTITKKRKNLRTTNPHKHLLLSEICNLQFKKWATLSLVKTYAYILLIWNNTDIKRLELLDAPKKKNRKLKEKEYTHITWEVNDIFWLYRSDSRNTNTTMQMPSICGLSAPTDAFRQQYEMTMNSLYQRYLCTSHDATFEFWMHLSLYTF